MYINDEDICIKSMSIGGSPVQCEGDNRLLWYNSHNHLIIDFRVPKKKGEHALGKWIPVFFANVISRPTEISVAKKL